MVKNTTHTATGTTPSRSTGRILMMKPRSGRFVRKSIAMIVVVVASGIAMHDRPAVGQAISYTTGTYSQNFSGLSTTAGTSSINALQMYQVSSLAGGGTVTGWYVYNQNMWASGNRWFAADGGGSSTGGFRSLYSSSGGNLALGAQGSGGGASYYGVILQNNSGSTINAASLSWDAVMNRNPSTTANSTTMSWLVSSSNVVTGATGTNGTFNTSAGSWTTGTTYSTPSGGTGAPGTQAAINPMFTFNSPTLSLSSMSWTNGSYLYLRWSEADEGGSDATFGVDNFNLWTSGAASQSLTWNTTSGTWNTSTANWTGGSSNVFANGDSVTFSGTAGGTITLSGTLAPASFVVSATAGTYTFSGATPGTDRISGVSLAKSGAGTAVFTTANDLTAVNITGGVVSISGSNQIGGGLITVNGGQLTSTAGSAIALANALTVGGSNGTVDTGSQNLTVNGATTLNGILTKSGNGTLSLGAVTSGSAAGSLGGVNVAAGNLALTSGVVTLYGNSSLTGNLLLNGATRINVSNGATLSGTGQLQLAATGAAISNLSNTGGGSISTPIALNSTGIAGTPGSWSGSTYTPNTFVAALGATTTGTMTVSGTISGNADLTISNNTATGGGGGMLVLAAANTYTGNTLINTSSPGAGVPSSLRLDVNNALPTTGGVVVGTLANLGAAVLDMNGRNQQVAYLADGANVSGASKNLTIRNFGSSDSTLTISGSVTPGTAFSGVIGTGSTNKINLVKAGSNTQTLTGVNTYTGNTTISGGVLALSGAGSIASSPAITVGAGATLDGSAVTGGFTVANGQTLSGNGTIAGGATLGNGSTIAPGTAGTVGTITTADLTLSGGATWNLDFLNATTGAGTGWDFINSTGTVTLPGSALTLALSGAGTGFSNTADASWKILAASALGGTFNVSNFPISNTTGLNLAGGNFTVSNSGTAGTGLYLVFTAGQTLSWIGGTGNWDPAGGSNWDGGAWNPNKTALFGTGTAGTVTVTGALNAALGMQFDTTGYTVSDSAITLTGSTALANSITTSPGVTATVNSVLAGSNGFTKAGTGTLVLGGANTVTGDVSVSAGTLQTSAADKIANTANVTVGSGATLTLGGNDTIGSLAGAGSVGLGSNTLAVGANDSSTTFSGVASGAGGLTKTGTGIFTVSGGNTYTGATTINGGVLATSGNAIADTSAVTVGASGGFTVNGADTIGSLAGSGATTLNATLTTGSDGTSTTYSGAAGGTGGLTKVGAGTFTLSGANTYSGATTINAGTLATTANDVIADTSVVSVASGATFQVGGNDTIASLSGLGTASIDAGDTLTVAPAATGTFAGVLAGAGGFTKAGSATLALTNAANTVSNLTVSAGALSIGNTGALPTSGAVAVNDAGTLTLAVNGSYGGSGQTVTLAASQSASPILNITSGGTATLLSNVSLAGSAANRIEANGGAGSLTLAGNVTGAGTLLKQAGGNLILSGSNSGTWGTQVGNGTLTVNAGSGLGSGDLAMNQTATNNASLALNESVTVGNLSSSYGGASGNNTISVAASKTLTVTQTVSGTYGAAGGAGQTSSISGSGGFTKAGSATLTLAGANTYTGLTTVSAGTLATTVANAVSANTTVAGGATLALGGAQTFTSLSGAGTLAAGSSAVTVNNASAATIGTLTGDAGASLTKSGAGELTLAANNSGYGGSVSVTNGVLRATTGGALGTGGVSVAGNGTLFGAAGTAITNAITVATGSNVFYSENFNSIGSGLPTNWTIRTSATSNSLGTSGAFTTTPLPWSDSAGAFKNYASATLGAGASTAAQNAYADRALGVQQTTAFGDPGAAFNYAFSTTGQTIQGISFDLMQLNVTTRDTTWSIQYGIGASPTSFTTLGTFVTGTAFGITPRTFTTADFGTSLDNQANVVFRVAALTSSAGSGSRDAIAIDNFSILTPSAAAVIGSDITSGTATFSGGMTLNGPASLTAASGGTSLFSGAISGAGSIVKTGLGTVILSGSNTYSGGSTVSAGTLVAGNGAAFGTGGVTVSSGASLDLNGLAFGNTITNNGGSLLNAAMFTGTSSVSGVTSFAGNVGGSVVVNNGGSATFSGTVNSLTVNGGGVATLANGAALSQASLANDGLLIVNQATARSIASIISGSGSFQQAGSGVTTLTGANVFTGPTTVSAGGLLVDGANNGGGLTSVASGAWIGGSGSLLGDLVLASGAFLVFDPSTPLGLGVNGSVTLDNSFGVASLRNEDGSVIDWSPISEGTYKLIGTTTSSFNNVQNFGRVNALDIGGGRSAYFQNGSLELVIVPEPSGIALVGLGVALAGYAARKRRRVA